MPGFCFGCKLDAVCCGSRLCERKARQRRGGERRRDAEGKVRRAGGLKPDALRSRVRVREEILSGDQQMIAAANPRGNGCVIASSPLLTRLGLDPQGVTAAHHKLTTLAVPCHSPRPPATHHRQSGKKFHSHASRFAVDFMTRPVVPGHYREVRLAVRISEAGRHSRIRFSPDPDPDSGRDFARLGGPP